MGPSLPLFIQGEFHHCCLCGCQTYRIHQCRSNTLCVSWVFFLGETHKNPRKRSEKLVVFERFKFKYFGLKFFFEKTCGKSFSHLRTYNIYFLQFHGQTSGPELREKKFRSLVGPGFGLFCFMRQIDIGQYTHTFSSVMPWSFFGRQNFTGLGLIFGRAEVHLFRYLFRGGTCLFRVGVLGSGRGSWG